MYPVVVLSGGLGTRLAAVDPNLPKALLPVAGRPFIEHKLADLRSQGVERVVLLVGKGGELIERHVGDGTRYGLEVVCVHDGPTLLGTGGALRQALPHLGQVFWVTYGDTHVRVPMRTVQEIFDAATSGGLMTVLHNRDEWDRSNVRVGGGLVLEYRKGAPPGTFEHIDYGISILTAGALRPLPHGEPFDLLEVFVRLIRERRLAAYEVHERFYEIGTPESYRETDAYFRSIGGQGESGPGRSRVRGAPALASDRGPAWRGLPAED